MIEKTQIMIEITKAELYEALSSYLTVELGRPVKAVSYRTPLSIDGWAEIEVVEDSKTLCS